MPRVKAQRANKDYPDYGIKKGDTYYSWAFFRGRKQMSKTHPRPSQLTQTNMSSAYGGIEQVEDALSEVEQLQADGLLNTAEPWRLLAEALENGAADVTEASEAYAEQASNIEEGFQHATTMSEEAQEKADTLETAARTMEDTASDIGDNDDPEFTDEDIEQWISDCNDATSEVESVG
jgi:hypothetical protein